MAEHLSLEDVARLVSVLTERPVVESVEVVYTLDDVAVMTKMSLRVIKDDCRSGRVEHVHQGALRGMTRRQIDALIRRYSEGGAGGNIAPDSDLEQVREAARRSGARRGRSAA